MDTPIMVTARDTERAVQELLNAFLLKYFTGLPHASDLGPVTFPLCKILFNQTGIDAPTADRPQIHLVQTEWRPRPGTWWSPTEKLVLVLATWLVTVRAANAGADKKAEFTARAVADHLKELIEGRTRAELATKGIRHPQIVAGPSPLASIGFQSRQMSMRAEVRYRVPVG